MWTFLNKKDEIGIKTVVNDDDLKQKKNLDENKIRINYISTIFLWNLGQSSPCFAW